MSAKRNELSLESFFEYFCQYVSRSGKQKKIVWALVGNSLQQFSRPEKIPEKIIISVEGRDFIRYGGTVIEK